MYFLNFKYVKTAECSVLSPHDIGFEKEENIGDAKCLNDNQMLLENIVNQLYHSRQQPDI